MQKPASTTSSAGEHFDCQGNILIAKGTFLFSEKLLYIKSDYTFLLYQKNCFGKCVLVLWHHFEWWLKLSQNVIF